MKETKQRDKLRVIIAAYERVDHTVGCIRSLVSAGIEPWQIVLVDGGSSEATLSRLRQEGSGINLIESQGNLWWAEGMNVGIRQVLKDREAAYLVLLNQDCLVDPDTINTLLSYESRHPDIGVFASILLDKDDPERTLDAGYTWQPHRKFPGVWVVDLIFPIFTHYSKIPRQPFPTDVFTGRCVLVRRGVFEEIGLYDTKHFPQRGADDDLGIRANKAGIKMVTVPAAKVYTGVDDCGADRRPMGFWKQLNWSLRHPVGGQGLKVHFWFAWKHCPPYAIVPTYFYRIINLVRIALRDSRRSGLV